MKKLVTYLLILGLGLSTAMAAYAGGGNGYKQRGWLDQETLDKLPPEKKELVENAIDEARQKSMDQKDAIKTAMQNVRTALTAPEFDAAAYTKATGELQALMTQRFQNFSSAIAEVAPKLTQEERQILADAIKEKYNKPHGKRMYDKSGAKQQLKDSAEQMKKNMPPAEPTENQ